MKLEPLGKNIIVEEVAIENKTSGGLLLVTKAKKDHIQAKVVAKGPDAPGVLTIGDIVIISKYTHNELSYGEKDYLVVKPDDILTIVRE